MIHPDDDNLLKLKLNILDPVETEKTSLHFLSCEDCRERFRLLGRDLEVLESFALPPLHSDYPMPELKVPLLSNFWRIAAILMVAFSIGYASLLNFNQPAQVEPMQLKLMPLSDSLNAFVACSSDFLGR